MVESIKYTGHSGTISKISVSINGDFMASASTSGEVKVWEVMSGYCRRDFKFENPVKSLAFYPQENMKQLLIVAEGKNVHLINTGVGDKLMVKKTDIFFNSTVLIFFA